MGILHRAVMDGRVHQVRLLVSIGVSLEERGRDGLTPLMLTCYVDTEESGLRIARILVRSGAYLNVEDSNGMNVLHHACKAGKYGIVAFLLDEDAMVTNSPDKLGNTPLNYAAINGNPQLVKLLVNSLTRYRVDIDHRNKEGFTALLLATKNGHYQASQILLQEGRASTRVRDNAHFLNPSEWAKKSHSIHARCLRQKTAATRRIMTGKFGPQSTSDSDSSRSSISSLSVSDRSVSPTTIVRSERLSIPSPRKTTAVSQSFPQLRHQRFTSSNTNKNSCSFQEQHLRPLLTTIRKRSAKEGRPFSSSTIASSASIPSSSSSSVTLIEAAPEEVRDVENNQLRTIFQLYEKDLRWRPKSLPIPTIITPPPSPRPLLNQREGSFVSVFTAGTAFTTPGSVVGLTVE
ncbi:EHMT1 [Branchiostoma lanceolatum]|uniref:EHMT1 protein n=1 Tax=Branchiostoma lanceolatum TaxID=7740 RepID=A0A8J9YXC4_BRALA|nr:EHMT1 [Branchiostoma lanceolatum]